MSDPLRRQENTRSSLFEKVPADIRRTIDVAIIERCPPTFQAVWLQLDLAKFGVTYSAFYRYARRLRDRVNLAEVAALSADDNVDLDAPIHNIIARRLLDELLTTDDPVSIREIAPLLAAHRYSARSALHDRRQSEQSRLAWARLEHDRDRLRLAADTLQATRKRFLASPNHASRARLDHRPEDNPDSRNDPAKPDPAPADCSAQS